MRERTSSSINIYRNGAIILTVPITSSSKVVFKLMQEHYLQLDFVLASPVNIKIGDYVNDEIFGKFVITEEQMPTDDQTTGGYSYSLKFESWYMMWKNKSCMLSSGGKRKETQWYLTNTLSAHVQAVLDNLSIIGYEGGSYDVSTCERANEAMLVSYSDTKIITLLNNLATQWECEWWVTGNEGDFCIHFGKCEDTLSAPYTFERYVNVESMNIQRNSSTFANKIFAYGSNLNIPFSYRRDLVVKIANHNGSSYGFDAYSIDRKLTADMFAISSEASETANYTINGKIAIGERNKEITGSTQFYQESNPVTLYNGTYKVDNASSNAYQLSFWLHSIRKSQSTSQDSFKVTVKAWSELRIGSTKIAEGSVSTSEITGYVGSTPDSYYYQIAGSQNAGTVPSESSVLTADKFTMNIPYVTTNVESFNLNGNQRLTEVVIIQIISNNDNSIFWVYRPVLTSNTSQVQAQVSLIGEKMTTIDVDVTGGNEPIIMRLNPCNDQKGGDNYYKVTFYNKALTQNLSPALLVNFGYAQVNGGVYTYKSMYVDTEGNYKVPAALYTDDVDDPTALLRIGDSRLRLPKEGGESGQWACADGYILPTGYINTPDSPSLVEQAVVFENIYPSCLLKVAEVKTEQIDTVQEFDDDTQKSTYTWKGIQYHVKLCKLDGSEFAFDNKMRLDNTKFQMRFLTHDDADMSIATYPNNCKLAGMTFECNYNKSINYLEEGTMINADHQLTDEELEAAEQAKRTQHTDEYTVVRNDDFGCLLPNTTLCPQVGDPVTLIGWNVNAMYALGLIADAEQKLMQKAFDYAQALEDEQFTFECSMMSAFLFTLVDLIPLYDVNSKALYSQEDNNTARLYCKNDIGEVYVLPEVGDRVRIKHAAIHSGYKDTRIIGCEYKLDKPYDTPKFTCGETDAYSRLKKLEKEITKLS